MGEPEESTRPVIPEELMTIEELEKRVTEGRRGRWVPSYVGKYVNAQFWCTFCDDALIPWCWKQGHVAYCDGCKEQYNAVGGCREHPYFKGFNDKTLHVREEWLKQRDEERKRKAAEAEELKASAAAEEDVAGSAKGKAKMIDEDVEEQSKKEVEEVQQMDNVPADSPCLSSSSHQDVSKAD